MRTSSYTYSRTLADGRLLTVELLTAGACLAVGSSDLIDDLWLYDTLTGALAQARTWDGSGEPGGWSHHPPTGRRRPGGAPAAEYVWH
jgi:hypothetical protein